MVRQLTFIVMGLMLVSVVQAEAIPVELRQTDEGWQLLRGGEPYFIHGAGGDASLERLAALGANSIRTWGVDNADTVLDEAHAHGLTVTLGIWLEHESKGIDYDNPEHVAAEFAKAREAVLKYRDHPALLLWGVGNEVEGFGSGDDPAIWKALNDIAAMVKELDPNHPTMVVTSEAGGGRIASVHADSPAIDIHGINTYGGAPSLVERLRKAGATKPYVITEFGPLGAWEMPATEWGAPIEQTSSQKAAYYRECYEKAVVGSAGMALGSYAFLWGSKMEATSTWFGMLLDNGAKLAQADVMSEIWTGTPPANLSPAIEPIEIDADTRLQPGATLTARVDVDDPEGAEVTVTWVLRPESGDYHTAGDFRHAMPDIDGAVVESSGGKAVIRMPDEPGQYRLFAYAYDEAGNAATANIPMLVKGSD